MDGMSLELLSHPVSLRVCERYLTVLKCIQSTTKTSQEKGILQAVKVISGPSKTVCRELVLKQKFGTASK